MTDLPAEIQCPVCAGAITEATPRTCPRCDTPHHGDCWDYVGGCAIFGCRPAEAAEDTGGLPAVRGAVAPVGAEVAGLARWFLRVVKVHWWALLVMGLGFAWMPLMWLPMATPIFRVIGVLFPFAYMALGLMATATYLLLVPPLIYLQDRLATRLGGPVQAPSGGARNLLDSLEVSPTDGALLRLVDAGPRLYAIATVFAVVLAYPFGLALLGWSLCAVPALQALQGFTRDRVVAVQALQNRLAASMKAKG